jgi:hypothetical protein
MNHMSSRRGAWHGFGYGVWAVLMAVALAACAGAGSRVQTTPAGAGPASADQQLIGSWELVGLEVQRDGRLVPRDARGELRYDEFANISVQVELLPSNPDVTPPQVVLLDFTAKASLDRDRGEVAYIGVQPRAPSARRIPDAVAPAEWRHFQLEGDVLRLSVIEGGRPVGTLTWRRAGR